MSWILEIKLSSKNEKQQKKECPFDIYLTRQEREKEKTDRWMIDR